MAPTPRLDRRASLVASIGLALLLGGLSLPGRPAALAQDSPRAGRAARAPRYVFGARNCRGCHAHPENYRADGDRLICRMSEFPTWDEKDKHKLATQVLSEARARRIGERLGIDATTSKDCLACHGLIDVDRAQQFTPKAEGVTCVACHGPQQRWVLQHQLLEDDTWLGLTRRQKQGDYGMIDLWDPVTRAATCFSCHVGDAREGKVITHAMYAAGHPPLPGIEVATFSEAQPRHWQDLKQKPREIQRRLGFDPRRHEQAELVAVSGLVALREAMRLFADEAGGPGLPGKPEWPDFARFDCWACHHDLQAPGDAGWRQRRGFAAEPGRPPAPTWSGALVRVGLAALPEERARALDADFSARIGSQVAALGRRPFGDRPDAAAKARALSEWADAALGELRKVSIDRGVALRLLRAIADQVRGRTPDYDAARQLAWAFRAIYRELDPRPPGADQVAAILADIDRQLVLTLPPDRRQTAIEPTLPARLSAVADYDPVAFRAAFARLVPLLPPR